MFPHALKFLQSCYFTLSDDQRWHTSTTQKLQAEMKTMWCLLVLIMFRFLHQYFSLLDNYFIVTETTQPQVYQLAVAALTSNRLSKWTMMDWLDYCSIEFINCWPRQFLFLNDLTMFWKKTTLYIRNWRLLRVSNKQYNNYQYTTTSLHFNISILSKSL